MMRLQQDCLGWRCFHGESLWPRLATSSCAGIRCCDKSERAAASASPPSSARERRKERNERREQHKTPWREIVEEMHIAKKKRPPKGLKYELDMTSRITARGMQWWMVLVPIRLELDTAEELSSALANEFPDEDIEVYVPSVPSKRKLKDGSISPSTQRLHSGCVFLRCVLTREIHDAVKRVPRVRGFFGKKVAFYQVTMPTPVPFGDIERLQKKVREEELDFERLQELANEERKMKLDESELAGEKDIVNTIGSNIRVVKGPYANFEGRIIGLSDTLQEVEAEVIAFGEVQKIALNLDEIQVLPGSGEAVMHSSPSILDLSINK